MDYETLEESHVRLEKRVKELEETVRSLLGPRVAKVENRFKGDDGKYYPTAEEAGWHFKDWPSGEK